MQVPLDILFAFMILPLMMKICEATAIAVYSKNSMCDTDGATVCATNGTDYVLFPNECQLKEANQVIKALHAGFEKVSMGFCQTHCNLICPTYVLPICAIQPTTGFRRSFNNPCELSRDACLNNIAWKFLNDGHCVPQLQATKKRAPIPCPEKFNPVCAIFAGVKSTFNNECLVNAENIKTGKDWTVFSQGICAEDYKSYGYNNDNAGNQKYIRARSYDEEKYLAKYAGLDNLGEDVTYIIAAPSFQTEFVDEAYNGKFLNPGATIKTYRYNKHSTPKVISKSAVPSRTIKTNDDDSFGKIRSCKYGSQPVCGLYGGKTRSFGNVCELMLRNILLNQSWTPAYAGKCITTTCPEVCTKVYAPLCVSKNGANFTVVNQCFLELHQCQDAQSTWKVIAQGECVSKVRPHILSATAATTKPLTSVHETASFGFRFTSKYMPSTSPSTHIATKTITATTLEAAVETATEAATTTDTVATTTASLETDLTTTTAAAMTPATTTTYETTTLIPLTTDSEADTEKSMPTTHKFSTATTTTLLTFNPSSIKTTSPDKTSVSYKLTTTLTSPSSDHTTTTASLPSNPTTTTTHLSPDPTTTTTSKFSHPIITITYPLSDPTTTTPIPTFVVSAKQSPKSSSSRSSVYSANRNSVIMRLVKSRALDTSKSSWTSSWRRVFSNLGFSS